MKRKLLNFSFIILSNTLIILFSSGCTSSDVLLKKDFPNYELKKLSDTSTTGENILSDDDAFNLIIIVKENDCHSCLEEIKEYNKLNNEVHPDNLKITMIYQGSFESGKKLISDYKINFRVLIDDKMVFEYDDFFSSPVKFLVQKLGNRRAVVFTSFKNNNLERQKKFSAVIKEIVYGLFY